MAIPVKTPIWEVDSLEGEETDFYIGDPRFVMQALADLYSNRELAVVREYSTNARDAMDEAGNSNPILVTLPTILNPEFRVKDLGVGMDLQTLKEVYTSFGDSTKREQADTNGQLGFGCKSGVAYTTQFQVITVKNGMKHVAIISRKPDWSIVLKVVASSKTTEPNGTEVIVPVHNAAEFEQKARDFYKFWLPGTVLVNGKAPESIVGEKIANNMYYSEDYDESYVVMGHVAYPITNPRALFYDLSINAIDFVLYVPNGTVEFVNNREALKYTDHTKNNLARLMKEFETEIIAKAKDEINNAPGFPEAYAAWVKWTNALGQVIFGNLTYRGVKLDADFDIKAKRFRVSSYQRRNTVHSIDRWKINQMTDTLIVTGYNYSVASAHKAKVKEYLNKKGISATYVLFTPALKIDNPWISADRMVSWDTVKKECPTIRQASTYSNHPMAGREKGSWDYYEKNGAWHTEEPLPDSKHLYWISYMEDKDSYSVVNILKSIKADGPVVVVPGNREAKFLRDNPKAKRFIPYAQKFVVKDGPSLLSADARAALRIGKDTQSWVKYLDATQVDDPEFKELARLVNLGADDSVSKYEKNLTLANRVGLGYTVKRASEQTSDAWLRKYPVLTDIAGTGYYATAKGNKKHITLYLNAAYAAREEA